MENEDKLSHFRCYWTRPFGHVWKKWGRQTSYERSCVLCGKYSVKGNYDGDWKYDLEEHEARAQRVLDKKKKRLKILEGLIK